MNATTLEDFLEQRGACEEARDWQRGKHLEEVWATCGRGDWMLWLVCRAVNRRKLADLRRTFVLVAVELAESVLHLVPTDGEGPRAALVLVRRKLAGENVSLQQLREAAKVAKAAYWASVLARTAAWARAAYWAAEAAYFATRAWTARAADAAWTAGAAAYWAGARAAAPELQAKQADIVRKHLPYETIAPLFHN